MKRKRRSATVLVCVLACLLVVMGITAAMVKSALLARQFVRQERVRAQAAFLLEAGIERAVAQLGRNADYQGESWQLPAAVLGGSLAGRVDITVSETNESRSVALTAQYPADTQLGVRRSYTFTISNEE